VKKQSILLISTLAFAATLAFGQTPAAAPAAPPVAITDADIKAVEAPKPEVSAPAPAATPAAEPVAAKPKKKLEECAKGPNVEFESKELETEINQFVPHSPTIVRVHASHGFAVSKLRELLDREPGIGVDLRYVSNPTSLASLVHGGCDLAGMHLPQGALRKRSIAAAKEWLSPTAHRVIGFVTREMGLIVKRGNPLGIRSLEQLADPKVRFVNRDPDSGTRLLFDQLLAQHRIEKTSINGYEQVEFTHAAVAAYVASGMADVSFGVEAAAHMFDLDFVRVVTEDYFFVCSKQTLEMDAVQRVLGVMRSKAFHEAVAELPGYMATDSGVIKSVREALQ